jgi:hypothetical protein
MNDGMGGEVDADMAARVMALILDSADPSHATEQRDVAFEAAMDLNPTATAVLATGYLRVVLNTLHAQFGPAAASHVISHLASASANLLDAERSG